MPDFVTLGGISPPWALGWAILDAPASNFYFNKYWTSRDRWAHSSAWAACLT